MGTYIGATALLRYAEKPLDAAAGLAIRQWLKKLGAVAKTETEKAFTLVDGKSWIDTLTGDPLLKRHYGALGTVKPL